MIPIKLELHNFLAYRDPEPLDLEGVHIACLVGANGSGKSALLDAITWSLWGKARVSTPDDLIHQGEKEMRVALTFEQGRERYRATRHRKTGKRGTSLLELQVQDPASAEWMDMSGKTVKDTQQQIIDLISLEYDTFINSAFLAQGRADEFTTKTPSQRKQVLAGILELSRWEIYERNAKDQISDRKASLQRLDGSIEAIDSILIQKETHEAEMITAESDALEVSERLVTVEKQWTDLEKTRTAMINLQPQIADQTRQITSKEKEIADAGRELVEIQAQANKVIIEKSLKSLKKTLAEIEPLRAELDTLKDEQSAIAEESARLLGVNTTMTLTVEPLKDRIGTLEAATEPICPTCSQSLTDDHRVELIASLNQEVEARRAEYRANSSQMDKLTSQGESHLQEYAKLKKQLDQRPALEKSIGQLETSLTHADEAVKRADGLRDKVARWTNELKDTNTTLEALTTQFHEAESLLKASSLAQRDVDQLRQEKSRADQRVGAVRQKLEALKDMEQERIGQVKERDVMADDLGIYEELREAFGKKGVPAMIIETVVPEIERSTNELLGRMTDGRMRVRIETQREIKTGELREALDIIISDELGTRSYDLYSGGEAFRINFAIRIAISRLLARRSGAQLRSLFIDEGFGTQDARGREQLIAAINTIQDDFDRILVITHIDELKDAFPSRIEVAKTPQGSQFSFV